jgi:hypothetical protein
MSTKSAKLENGPVENKKETATTVVGKPKSATEKKDVFAELMKHLNELEQLRSYYNRLKVKKDTLQTAYRKMVKHESDSKDHFEEGSKKQFPFEIVIRGEDEYNRTGDIFKINQPNTVTSFTKYLLNEVEQLLEVFEADIVEHSKKIK